MSDGDDTRQRILTAAGYVFAEKGFQDATVRDILRRADVENMAAVNYYFGSKEKLYLEVVRQAHMQRTQEVPLPQWPPGTPTEEKLAGFIHTMMTRMVKERTPGWQIQILMREVFHPTEACTEMVREFIRPHFEILLGILKEVTPPDISPKKLHLIAFSIVGQCLYHRIAQPVVALLVGDEEFRSYDAESLARHIAEFSLAALGLKPPLNRSAHQ
ncbi:MAG: transcriptional regulator [Gemmatales bacterium]|nr:MAG: transcriptional regulator [Gemmatales bacterium]